MKASDISDFDMLIVIDRIERSHEGEYGPVFTFDLYEEFEKFPSKVVLAKLRALLKKKLIEGCGCGCRGDFHVTGLGSKFLVENKI